MQRRSEIITREGRLYHLGIAPEEIRQTVFLVGDPARAYKVASRFESIEHQVTHREFVTLTGLCRGLPMSVVGTGIGTDNVEIALIELHAAHTLDLDTGLPKIDTEPLDLIRIGTSGGVQVAVSAGTLCIGAYALGLDCTGIYYEAAPADDVVRGIESQAQELIDGAVEAGSRFESHIKVYASKANPAVVQALEHHAAQGELPSASGITASSSGFFGASSRYIAGLVNTVPDIKALLAKISVSGQRVLNMEMESSLLYHLAGALGHRAGTICPTISQPGSHGSLVEYDKCIEAAIDVAIEAGADLQTQPRSS